MSNQESKAEVEAQMQAHRRLRKRVHGPPSDSEDNSSSESRNGDENMQVDDNETPSALNAPVRFYYLLCFVLLTPRISLFM